MLRGGHVPSVQNGYTTSKQSITISPPLHNTGNQDIV
jgi:hypothetical protein